MCGYYNKMSFLYFFHIRHLDTGTELVRDKGGGGRSPLPGFHRKKKFINETVGSDILLQFRSVKLITIY
jgi:hypothetical protein